MNSSAYLSPQSRESFEQNTAVIWHINDASHFIWADSQHNLEQKGKWQST